MGNPRCVGQLMDAQCVDPSRVTAHIRLACRRYSSTARKLGPLCNWTGGDWSRSTWGVSGRSSIFRWHNYIPNNEVLRQTGLLAASSIVRKRHLGLFGHVARLADDVLANRILWTCCKAQDSLRPCSNWRHAQGRPPTTWTQQICRDTGVTVTDDLSLEKDRSFWRQIAMAGSYGWTLRVQEERKEKIFAVLVEWYYHIILTMSFKLVSFFYISNYVN